jgi:hypothetical protein
VYGGFELADIRDNQVLEREDQLGPYVDGSLLSDASQQQEPLPQEVTAPIVTQLKCILSNKVCWLVKGQTALRLNWC